MASCCGGLRPRQFIAQVAQPPSPAGGSVTGLVWRDFSIGGHGPILGDDAFTRVSVDAGATVMRVDVYDRKGGLLDAAALPL